MISAIGMVRAQLLLGVKSHCRRDCGESGRPLCRAHEALAALERVAGEERERCARMADENRAKAQTLLNRELAATTDRVTDAAILGALAETYRRFAASIRSLR